MNLKLNIEIEDDEIKQFTDNLIDKIIDKMPERYVTQIEFIEFIMNDIDSIKNNINSIKMEIRKIIGKKIIKRLER